MNKYVTEKEFAKLSKGKKVKEYPNPLIKEIDGQDYEICTKDCKCFVSKMPREHYPWYIGRTFEDYQKEVKEKYGEDDSEVITIRTNTKAGYKWFPTELVCGCKKIHIGAGIIRDMFSIDTDLARKTGCMLFGENQGSAECNFRSSKVDEAIRILNANHWKCEIAK